MSIKRLENLLDACKQTKNNEYKVKWLKLYYEKTVDVFEECLAKDLPIPNEYLKLDEKAQLLVEKLEIQGLWN